MKKSKNSEWRLSMAAIATTIGTFLSIFIMQGELNAIFAMWYLAVVVLVIAGNAIYVFYKRKTSSGKGDENSTHG